MPDLLQTASAWLGDQLAAHAAQPIEYSAGGDVWLPMMATMGATVRTIDRGDGLLVQAESIDFLVAAADLVVDGEEAKPQPGHRIRVRLTARSRRTYEVQGSGAGDPCWEPSDHYGLRIRVHTKLIESV